PAFLGVVLKGPRVGCLARGTPHRQEVLRQDVFGITYVLPENPGRETTVPKGSPEVAKSVDGRQRPTLEMVAERAGVGRGTVSRVINGSAQVSPRTREAVRNAIAE